MESKRYEITDHGEFRVLAVDGKEHRTYYSERVIRMLIERKGIERTPPYFSYKEARGRRFLGPLFEFFAARGIAGLKVLEVGCSFGHITEFLNEEPRVSEIWTFDPDLAFAEMTRAKVEELGLSNVREIRHLTTAETRRLPYEDGAFDLVLAIGVVEHLPTDGRHLYVDEYYRVVRNGGFVVILDTPNRWFPIETHSVGLPLVQWLPPELAFVYAKAARPLKFRDVTLPEFTRAGTGWRNATYAECLPRTRMVDVRDLTEEAGYGFRFFRSSARSLKRKAVMPLFAGLSWLLRKLDIPPSLVLPYLNLVFQKRRDYEESRKQKCPGEV